MVGKYDNSLAFWIDETRYVIVPSHRYKKLREEFDATLVAARLLNWTYGACWIDNGYEMFFNRVDGAEMLGMSLYFMKSDNRLDWIGMSLLNEPMMTKRSWLESIRKFRKFL